MSTPLKDKLYLLFYNFDKQTYELVDVATLVEDTHLAFIGCVEHTLGKSMMLDLTYNKEDDSIISS